MEKIKIMVSSKVVGLEAERDAIAHVFKDNRMIELIGANPFADESRASSSAVETIKMARDHVKMQKSLLWAIRTD